MCSLLAVLFLPPRGYSQFLADKIGHGEKHLVSQGPTPLGEASGRQHHLSRTGVTSRLLRSSTYRQVGRHIERLREKRVGSRQQDVGDIRPFFVRDVMNLSRWKEVEGELLLRTSMIQLWMETEEKKRLQERGLLPSLISPLSRQTAQKTPVGSVDSTTGIIPLAHRFFGHPPDVDRDGRVDVLLLDIEDQFEKTGAYVAGFFDPNDLTTNDFSNRRDLIYIDTTPTIVRRGEEDIYVERAASTVAHEYQHLIHANYEGDKKERIFINEGLSEFAEILCGYSPRPADAYFRESGRPLLSWNYDDPLPDYARASLFMHYFLEQVGYSRAKELVQNADIGVEGLRAVLQRTGGPTVETLFQNWGRALLLNDRSVHSAYGYRHPRRKNVQFTSTADIRTLPGLYQGEMGGLSHLLIDVPLIERLSIREQSRDRIAYDAYIRYPGQADRFQTDLDTRPVIVDENTYASVRVLASKLSGRPDTFQSETQFLAQGRRAAHHLTLSYDDGIPDVYGGNASYLLLEAPGEAVGLAFDPRDQSWLHGVATNVVFLSEVAGTGVPAEAPRRIRLQVRSLVNGRPGPPLTPPLVRAVDRSPGNLRIEPLSLVEQYDALSALSDSFVVVLGSGESSNPLAVGMDRTSDSSSAGSAFHRKEEQEAWTEMSHVRAEGSLLKGFRPMIRSLTAVPERQFSASSLEVEVDHDFEKAFVRLRAPFSIDSSGTHLLGRLPSGRVIEAQWLRSHTAELPLSAHSESEVVLSLPAESGSPYEFHARAASNERMVVRRTFSWQIPEEEAVTTGSVYPNPSAGDVHVPITLLQPARVTVTLFDVLGRVARELAPRPLRAGDHQLRLTLQDLSSGVYFARIRTRRKQDATPETMIRKVVRVR